MIDLTCLNSLERAAFVAALDGVFEHSPWVAERTWDRRPFRDLHRLHEALVSVVEGASDEDKLQLIRAHPDLVGQAVRDGTLTTESRAEQAGIDALTPEDVARFDDYNARYRERFGFPFVICVRYHKKAAILAGFERRLQHDPATERQNALTEIGQIARRRLGDRISH